QPVRAHEDPTSQGDAGGALQIGRVRAEARVLDRLLERRSVEALERDPFDWQLQVVGDRPEHGVEELRVLHFAGDAERLGQRSWWWRLVRVLSDGTSAYHQAQHQQSKGGQTCAYGHVVPSGIREVRTEINRVGAGDALALEFVAPRERRGGVDPEASPVVL